MTPSTFSAKSVFIRDYEATKAIVGALCDAAPMALMALVDKAGQAEAPAADEGGKKAKPRRKKAAKPAAEAASEAAAEKKPRVRKKKAAVA